MLVFDQNVQDAVEAARAGRSIRVLGRRLSGRSTVLRGIVEALELTGHNVFQAAGDQLSRQQPGYVLEQLFESLAISQRRHNLYTVVDTLASVLSARDIIAIDNVNLADSLSLRVVSAVRQRVRVRVITTEVTGRSRDDEFPALWPEHVLAIPEVDLATSALLLQSVLGGPVDPHAHAQIYGKVGGNVGLTVALAESARHAELLIFTNGSWQARNLRLWNTHLGPLLSGLVAELEPEEQELVSWLAENGPTPLASVTERFSASVLRRVFEQHFAAQMGAQGALLVQVWPPILASRHQYSTDAHTAFPEDAVARHGQHTTDVAGNSLAMLAKEFADHEVRAAQEALRAWRIAPTLANALTYLRLALGLPREAEHVRRVFRQTPHGTRIGQSAAHLEYAVRRMQWLRLQEHDEAGADALLEQLRSLNPLHESALLGADATVSVFTGQGVPELAQLGAAATAPGEAFTLTGSMVAALARGELDRVEELLELARSRAALAAIPACIASAKLLFDGRVRDALRLTLERRLDARERSDRTQFCVLSYWAAVCAHHLGATERMHQYLSEGTVVGAPRGELSAFYGALFNMEAGAAHFNNQHALRDSLLREAAARIPSIGPFLGMSLEFLDTVIRHSDTPPSFARDSVSVVTRSRELGYRVGAQQTAVTALTIQWSAELAAAFLASHEETPLPLYAAAAAGARLVEAGDVTELRAWGQALSAEEDDADLLIRLFGAAFRDARSRGADELARALEEIVTLVLDRQAPAQLSEDDATVLSTREQQVAVLAGELTNHEIAERLGISRRTVENHIANALKKTRHSNRRELSRFATRR